MAEMFFPGIETGEVRGIVKLIKEEGTGDSMRLSALSRSAGIEIDRLFPILEACRMLGLASVNHGNVKLTGAGKRLNPSNVQEVVDRRLRSIEPFRTTLRMLSEYNRLTTKELADLLYHEGINLEDREGGHVASLRRLLVHWGARSGLMEYNRAQDRWSLKAGRRPTR